MKKKLEATLVKSLIPILRTLPLSMARSLGTSVGWLIGNVFEIRRTVVESNLCRVFPDIDEDELTELSNKAYKFFARAAVDWLRYEDVREHETITVNGWEHIEELQETGGIIASAHLGYWELAAIKVAEKLGEFPVYVDRQSNPETDKIIRDLRKSRSVISESGPSGLRKLVRRVQDGQIVGVVGDQRPKNQHEYVPFFNSRVKNTRILSFLARKTQRPVVPLIMVRSGDRAIELQISPALEASRRPVNEDNRVELLEEYNSWLEKQIRKYPGQYFWAHRRWQGAK